MVGIFFMYVQVCDLKFKYLGACSECFVQQQQWLMTYYFLFSDNNNNNNKQQTKCTTSSTYVHIHTTYIITYSMSTCYNTCTIFYASAFFVSLISFRQTHTHAPHCSVQPTQTDGKFGINPIIIIRRTKRDSRGHRHQSDDRTDHATDAIKTAHQTQCPRYPQPPGRPKTARRA